MIDLVPTINGVLLIGGFSAVFYVLSIILARVNSNLDRLEKTQDSLRAIRNDVEVLSSQIHGHGDEEA